MKYFKGNGYIFIIIILAALAGLFTGCAKSAHVNLTADKTQAVAGETIHFSIRSGDKIISSTWDFGDGGTSNEMNPTHVYKEAGVFMVTLLAFTEKSFDSGTLNITISASPAGKPYNPSLKINRIEMCSGPIQTDECKSKQGATFYTGDTVAVWFEITGFEVQGTGGKYEAWVQWRRYGLYAPDGGLITTDSNMHEWHEFPSSRDYIGAFHGWWNIGQVEAIDPRGNYRVEIEIEDRLSGKIVTEMINFVLK